MNRRGPVKGVGTTMKKKPMNDQERAKVLAELHRDVAQQRQSYRARALALFPHVCGRCARELDGKRLKELTVHHKDHNHNNNPPDGSNWELLCLYCHDHEHEKFRMAGHSLSPDDGLSPSIFSPFENLDVLIQGGQSDSKT